MARYSLKLENKNSVFLYDGSLAGFYTCIHVAIYDRELPLFIWKEDQGQQSLFFTKKVDTHFEKGEKVRNSLQTQLGSQGLYLIESVFFSCLEEKEKYLLTFILKAYQKGRNLLQTLEDPAVYPLYTAQRHLHGEVHAFEGFVRFEEVENILVSKIKPKNFVLPFLLDHFSSRYPEERWMIFDETHKMALCYEKGKHELIEMKEINIQKSQEEKAWQNLWKSFYETLSIKERENPLRRMNHMPKRYWSNLVEMQE